MENQLSEKAIASVKEYIDEKLRLRCINVETTLIQVERKRGGSKLQLNSTKFNTVPVIHSEIEIVDFGGSVEEIERSYIVGDGENKEIKTTKVMGVFIPVHVSYEGNGVALFTVNGFINTYDEFSPIR